MTQRQNDKRTLRNKHTYQDEPLPNRGDFVVSFTTGALIGSALGLYFGNKAYQKADDLKIREQELSQRFEGRKTQLEETVIYTKERAEESLNKSKNEQAALKAQQAAIKGEASANSLSDTSREAQGVQEAKREAQAETDENVAVSNKESKVVALKAQQAAIKERAGTNNLDDTSQEA